MLVLICHINLLFISIFLLLFFQFSSYYMKAALTFQFFHIPKIRLPFSINRIIHGSFPKRRRFENFNFSQTRVVLVIFTFEFFFFFFLNVRYTKYFLLHYRFNLLSLLPLFQLTITQLQRF